MRVAVAYSAQRDTLDTDLSETVAGLSQALTTLGHEAVPVPLGYDIAAFWQTLAASRADAVWNLCEEAGGRPGRELHAAALLELSDRPVTGTGAQALALCLDKPVCRAVLSAAGVPVAEAALVGVDGVVPPRVPLPCIVKPASQDASVGIDRDSVCQTRAQVDAAIVRLHAGGLLPALCERYIEGRELTVLLLGPGGAAPQHIAFGEVDFEELPSGEPRILTYAGKWHTDSEAFLKTPCVYPAQVDDTLATRLRLVGHLAFQALGLSGFARLDVRVDAAGRPWVIDVNGNPDITPGAGLQRALPTLGLNFPAFVALQLRWAAVR